MPLCGNRFVSPTLPLPTRLLRRGTRPSDPALHPTRGAGTAGSILGLVDG